MASKAALLTIFLTVFIDLIGFGMVLPLLPIYAKRFGTDPTSGWQIGLLMASFSAMQFLFSPLWGRLSDRIGRRPVLIVGLSGSVIFFYALFGVATVQESLTLLFVARIGAGIAGATISTAQAYIADSTTLEKRAKGMALIGAAFGLGFTLGPLFAFLGLPAEETADFKLSPWPGYAAAICSAVALLIAVFKLPESLPPGAVPSRRKLFDWSSLRDALRTPSLGLLMAAWFLCVFSFANFESTLSLLLSKFTEDQGRLSIKTICLLFAYIGLVLSLVQGGLVRRLSGRVDEGKLAFAGAAIEVVGFLLLIQCARSYSLSLTLVSLAVVVSGFAFMTPSVNSLISRRSDPAKQGGILGVAQSISSLARIVAPIVGNALLPIDVTYPLWTAAALMAIGGLLVLSAARSGRDYAV